MVRDLLISILPDLSIDDIKILAVAHRPASLMEIDTVNKERSMGTDTVNKVKKTRGLNRLLDQMTLTQTGATLTQVKYEVKATASTDASHLSSAASSLDSAAKSTSMCSSLTTHCGSLCPGCTASSVDQAATVSENTTSQGGSASVTPFVWTVVLVLSLAAILTN